MDPELSARVFMMEGRPGALAGATAAEAQLMAAWRSALGPEAHPLQVVAGQNPPNEQMIRALVDANTGTFNTAGVKIRPAGSAELARFTEGNQWAAIYSQILQGDITPALAGNPLVQNAVETVIRSDATLRVQYDALTPAQRRQVLINQLRNGKLQAEVARLLSDRAQATSLLDDQTRTLRLREQRAQERVQELEKDRQELEKQIKIHTAERREFETTAGGVTAGTYSQERAKLLAERDPAQQNVNQYSKQLEELNKLVLDREQRKAAFIQGLISTVNIAADPSSNARINQFNNDITDLKNQREPVRTLLEAQQKILSDRTVRLEAIERREKSVSVVLTGDEALVKRLQEVRKELGVANEELSTTQQELTKAIAQRGVQESQFIGSLASILPEAAGVAVNERLDKIVQEQSKIDQANTKEATSATERTIRDAITSAFRDPATGQTNWVTFDAAWNRFLTNGVDGLMDPAVAGGLLHGTGITLNQLRSHGEYEAIATALKEKMARYRMARPRRGALRRLQAGPEPLSRNEILAITNKFDDEYYNRVLAANTTLREQVNRACNDGVLNFTGRWGERLRRLPVGNILLVLALLLGGGALLSTTGAAGAAAGAIGLSP